MFKKILSIILLITFLSISFSSQTLKIQQAKLKARILTATSISIKGGEKLLVITAPTFIFESPAAVTSGFIYYIRSVLEIHSAKVPIMSFVAPVNIPEGSKIQRIGMCFSDSTMNSVVRLKLIHNNPINPKKNRGALAVVNSYKTGGNRKFAIAKSVRCKNVVVNIRKGYFYLTLSLFRNNRFCKFAYAYVVYK